MSDGAVLRTQYRNLSTGTVRAGPTGHGESLTDMESYLLRVEQARNSSLYSWGVATGLKVSAAVGQPGLRVSVGSALDVAGRLAVLSASGSAVVDPDVDPNEVVNIPTVTVGADGVALATAGLRGDRFVTLTWREVQSQGVMANAPVLLHTPWVRLVPVAGFQDVGRQVVLAKVLLDGDGKVTGLTAEGRRSAGVTAGRVELRVPRVQGGAGPAVEHGPAAELRATADGGVQLNLLSGGQSRPALSVTATGNVGIGTGVGQVRRTLQVEGTEVHSGGPGSGFSFADRTVGSLVEGPNAGERWVWYSREGSARLWSGKDRLTISATGEGGGLDVSRRMRVRQGGDISAGIWLRQDGPNSDRAFIGMADDTHVGFFGNTGAGWGMRMDTGTGEVEFSSNFGRPAGSSTLSLFGSQIGDTGGGVLFIRSGGGVVAFDGGDNVGINTRTPESPLDVVSSAIAIRGRGGGDTFQAGVRGTGNLGVWAEGTNNGILAAGPNFAGVFMGKVQIHGDLDVRGTVSKGDGGFRIDHPLDPANRYLSHSFVESPEMLNIYTGTVVTDDQGEATIALPGFFEALNRDHCFQVTPIGQLALATVYDQIRDNTFTIRTDKPGVTVSWQVTGVRQDPWADAHRIAVEDDKPAAERGRFLHPEMYNQPEELNVMGIRDGTGITAARRG